MKYFVVIFCVLLSGKCDSSPVEDSVVSVYTTQTSAAGSIHPPDVYHQIAHNIAERITSPIYRFLGFNSTPAAADATTKRPWNKIELVDDQELSVKNGVKPIDNDIGKERDVEELSVEALSKPDKKPEKFTLYSSLIPSYLPTKLEIETTTKNDDDFDSFELSDLEPEKPREGPLIFVLELIGSVIQLLWGGLMALFKGPVESKSDT